jgi:hypothetical protein
LVIEKLIAPSPSSKPKDLPDLVKVVETVVVEPLEAAVEVVVMVVVADVAEEVVAEMKVLLALLLENGPSQPWHHSRV